jgi:hypothetical protein
MPSGSVDWYLLLITTILLSSWLLFTGMRLETPYPHPLIEAYALPITRILLLALVLLSACWNPTVGILMALAYVSLGADVLIFTKQ